MPRFFNTTGLCLPERHYMLPPARRLPDLDPLFDEQAYFVIHAPRQSGKTTSFHHLARRLTAAGEYAAVLASCEAGRPARDDVDRGVEAVIRSIDRAASLELPEELRPDDPDNIRSTSGETRLLDYLTSWSQRSPRPVILFLDEIDALFGSSLLSVLHQLRSGYGDRPRGFPHSMALIGLRDVRDYRVRDPAAPGQATLHEIEEILGTSSPFNIKVESLTLRNFYAEEVAELYAQHTEETGQGFTPEAAELAWYFTGGQPWLVNALARQLVREAVTDRDVEVTKEHVEAAKEALILRRDTHLDSLAKRLEEPRVRRVIEPIVAGIYPRTPIPEDDLDFVEDLGLVVSTEDGLAIANPIYREVIPRALTSVTERLLPISKQEFVGPHGRLLWDHLLDGFVAFWREHAESFLGRQPYHEAAGQLIFTAWLQRIVSDGGMIDREYAAGLGRIDLNVRWPLPDGSRECFAVEMKVWAENKGNPEEQGLAQLSLYLHRLGLNAGTLLIFDQRATAPPFEKRGERQRVRYDGRDIVVLRL